MQEQDKVISVIIDACGGDNAPKQIVEGAILAVNEYKNVKVILVGKEEEIKTILSNLTFDQNKVEVLDARSVITNDDSPVEAIRTKKNSSLVVALERLKQDDSISGLVSAGSTGAVLTGGFLKIGRLSGISRPALAPVLPTINGGNVVLIDCGANMDSSAENLAHFALMGSLYSQAMFNIVSPRVALLNVGVEDKKGNELVKQVFPLLRTLPINFVGNMEARDTLSGDYDVIVADGFAGNVLLKSTEGAVSSMLKMLKAEIKASKLGMFGALFMRGAFKRLKVKLDHSNKGGSPFLGAKKVIIKSHGSSTAITIKTSIKQVIELEQAKMQQKLSEEINRLNKIKE
ncbi:MAG: phosphate acyltransferase PlsX [Clostridia bacterium]|nr:phosphate acyltransferase PlsX [Clostridia bacterium]